MSPVPTYQIIAIQLSAQANARGYRHIEYVCLQPKPGNQAPWVWRAGLAEDIDKGIAKAIVELKGTRVTVGIERVGNIKYLRTLSDDTVEDNLLHLPTYNAAGQLLPRLK